MKTFAEQLEAVVATLRKEEVRFALAGGLVASLYRKEERLTKDFDFLFVADEKTEKRATQILEKIGLIPTSIRIAELAGGPMHEIKNRTSSVAMICGLPTEGSDLIQVDFLLPAIPWFGPALLRAEKHLVDFGFGKLPCLTVEDIILSKLYALENRTTRFKDLDDLQSIFQSKTTLDLNYLTDKIEQMKLKIPPSLSSDLPPAIRNIWKRR